MKTVGIFYGSTTGNTETIAQNIAAQIGTDNLFNIASSDAQQCEGFDLLLFGSSTWGFGDLQDDWEAFLPKLASCNLSGKAVGFFGCGDSSSYPDTFCDALAEIKAQLGSTGCRFIGEIPSDGYTFDATRCQEGDHLIGCCLDEMNEGHLTDERIGRWIELIKAEL